jgi:hypothetical protein
MGQYTYYCEVNHTRVDIAKGVYSVVAEKGINHLWFPELNRLVTVSDRVWKQGPKGGIKIIKDRSCLYPMGYITTDEKWMKKFAWVKLKAKEW